MGKIAEMSLRRKPPEAPPMDVAALRDLLTEQCEQVRRLPEDLAARGDITFVECETAVRQAIFALGRVMLMLFLAVREERMVATVGRVDRAGRRFRPAPAIARSLTTMFGVVRYARTYMREIADGARRGYFPLDQDLGLTSDRFSWSVISEAVRLCTAMSFSQARETLKRFVPGTPSTEVMEQAVLGLGRRTEAWFSHAPVPDGDGDVLIAMFDSKGAPTATAGELMRRRGKRRKRRKAASPRHRGRARRTRYPKKPRRKKGDKSKNAKLATMVVMYTLKRRGKKLLGPINRWVYASFAPKRHCFEVARREADRRGFTEASGKLVQVVTDGDDDLAVYTKELFPSATHTVDVMHVVEKLWTAGECVHDEGSAALNEWVAVQRDRLYGGKVRAIIDELQALLDATPKTGPGNKGKRERLARALGYIKARTNAMNYDKLIAKDLEIGSGPIEGAIKNVIGRRFDHGGMRWIKERAEALLQLRCIEVNGQWDAFMSFAHVALKTEGTETAARPRLQARTPGRLPTLARAA
jgi:hypothetical protein